MRSLGCVCVSLMIACGGSGSEDGPDAGESTDGTDDGGDDGSAADAQPPPPDAGPADGGVTVDAAPTGMIIDAVVVDGSFTQVPQGATFEISVTGSGFEEVTDIVVADAFIDSSGPPVVTATEVRATMALLSGAQPGPRTVTLVGPDGSVSAPDAMEVTPVVVEPDAAPDGRGTFESPMLYCDGRLGDRSGSILLLRAGEHVCEQRPYLGAGNEVRGEGVDVTVLRSPGFAFSTEQSVSASVQDLTLISPDPAGLVSFSSFGPVAIRDVRIIGAGIESGTVTEGPVAAGLMERVDISSCGTALFLADGQWTLTGITVEGCEEGLRLLGVREDGTLSVEVIDSEFLDNRFSMTVSNGSLRVTDSAVRDVEATPAVAEVGIRVGHGEVGLRNVEMTGIDQTGIIAEPSLIGGEIYQRATLNIDGLSIVGGQIGIRISGGGEGAATFMNNSSIRDQTIASFRFSGLESTRFSFSNVELSVVSGFALEDLRPDPDLQNAVNSALFTTLNGNSYQGQLIEGPIDVPPDFRIVDNSSAIQF
jgi:hypothetical protein